ncbi:HNH endonuclease [Nocardioides psychrotolerans]|uniref:HNH nuclease domain-containing protein n=1 Tax=Nocardioides psychrotolerans TaxID=1005945 RepID=A0A1I3NP99_9ACTN|nr:HNH endonuclease signature motif containing protein [Nocardioides psychrotolerans]GEP39393.1 HNH endonuclease [Nocardioides psychrotolerans]SFJ10987.1 protein of unknown function [Nocardioides psychrotolerans]
MTSTGQHVDRGHPISVGLEHLKTRLALLAQAPVWSMHDAEVRQAVLDLTEVASQVAALEITLLAHAQRTGAADEVGATSVAAWWAHETRTTAVEAHRRVKHAVAVEDRHAEVGAALSGGGLRPDQARAVVDAVDALPADVGPQIRDQAREHLLAQAAHHDAKALRILGKRVLDVVAPEVGEAQLANELAAEERAAQAGRRFTMVDDGHGKTYGRFTLPTYEADMLRTALQALASPRRDGGGASPEGMGRAFGEYVQRFPTDRLPDAGGVCATVVVTMDIATLMGDLKAASLDTGTIISPGLARQLACKAGVIPVVLGGASQVLDIGRKRRFHTTTQHIALATRDQGCTTIGCTRPPAWCEAHHDTPWSRGGGTSVEDGRLLCSRDHHLAHHPAYAMTQHPSRKVSFTRRE